MTKDLISIVDHDESIRRTTTLQMRGMHGLQLRNHLAARCGIPSIFITAYQNQDSRQQAMRAGADAFLASLLAKNSCFKPVVRPCARKSE